MRDLIRRWKLNPAASGTLIFLATMAAMFVENSPWSHQYDSFLNIPFSIQFGALIIAKPLLLWINDGLMAIFFFLVGLELKREFLEGHLSQPSNVALPLLGALGGIAVPAGIYTLVNSSDPVALEGWAIPTATDIAFALGILALLGNRVQPAAKLFLLTLAIIDDLAAIVIIAIFYTGDLGTGSLYAAGGAMLLLAIMNRVGVRSIAAYSLVGVVLWVSVLKSGVHATLAGVALAMAIPLFKGEGDLSPLRKLEHDLHDPVGLGILPLFAFANAGIPIDNFSPASLLDPIALGIALGLFLGKQLGVFGFVLLGVKSRLVRMPDTLTWPQFYGLALLCGVGFTMSLFIGSLAFEHSAASGSHSDGFARLGILSGSAISGLLGFLVLHFTLPKPLAASHQTKKP
ncbi:MAG: Na+/H+ antiporter NhaA [Magnetococcales bacterium]|nr:Na+/H+ antiporter NhaA [Magnetococcales bacterium]